jgi:hypothetical protein
VTDRDFTAEHERFAFDDAAYVLGALDAEDAVAFEQHLQSCAICALSVAELADLPPLLSRVEPTSLHFEPPPDTLLPRLLQSVARARSRRSWRNAAVGFVAACVLGVLLFGGVTLYGNSHQPKSLTMQAVGGNSNVVQATIRLLGDGSSTRIKLDCGYGSGGGQPYPGGTSISSYTMVVYNRAGLARDLGSWTPQPGEDVEITRNSPWPRQALSKIEIANDEGAVLLQLSL